MQFKTLEEKCLYYRELTDFRLLPNQYVLVMLDGKNFSNKVKSKFKKPFDDDFIEMMNKTVQYLCEKIQGCKFGYVQSDEISLLITDMTEENSCLFYNGRLCKLQSIIASMATAKFNQLMAIYHHNNGSEIDESLPMYEFDCKAWNVPNKNEAFAWFLYRQKDCIRNSKQQFSQAYACHKELLNKTAEEQINYVNEQYGQSWKKLDEGKKYGRIIVEETITETRYVEKLQKDVTYDRVRCFVKNAIVFRGNKEDFFKLSQISTLKY